MSGVAVEVAALRRHARNVAGLDEEIARARATAAAVDLGPDTFGRVGALVVGPALSPLQAVGVTVLDLVGGALGSSAAGVAAVAEEFERVETDVRARFEKVGTSVVRVVVDHLPPVPAEDRPSLRERLGDAVRPLVLSDTPGARTLVDRVAS